MSATSTASGTSSAISTATGFIIGGGNSGDGSSNASGTSSATSTATGFITGGETNSGDGTTGATGAGGGVSGVTSFSGDWVESSRPGSALGYPLCCSIIMPLC